VWSDASIVGKVREFVCVHVVREYDETTKRACDCELGNVHCIICSRIDGSSKSAEGVAVERDYQLFRVAPLCPCTEAVVGLEIDFVLTAVGEEHKSCDARE